MTERTYIEFDFSLLKDQLKGRKIVSSILRYVEGGYFSQVLTLDDGDTITLMGVDQTEDVQSPEDAQA